MALMAAKDHICDLVDGIDRAVRSLEEHEQAARDRDIMLARALVRVADDDPIEKDLWSAVLVMANE